jgi:hypothetical protein
VSLAPFTNMYQPKREDFTVCDGLITYKDGDTGVSHYLGYLMPFPEHGIHDPDLGQVDVDPAWVDAHNAKLSDIQLDIIDNKLNVGESYGPLYVQRRVDGTNLVTTWPGTRVDDDTSHWSQSQVKFTRKGRTFTAHLKQNHMDDSITIKRVK